jgi:hypothetical protein
MSYIVTPAKAGVPLLLTPYPSGIPAFAGMTACVSVFQEGLA